MSEPALPPSTSPARGRRAPTRLLVAGLGLTIATIALVGLYTFREIRDLRDRQTAISDRNRKDSLQLLRIQNDLSSLALLMRDMADRTEPYPLAGWRPAFDRLRADLADAVALERTLAPTDRESAQQARLEGAIATFWGSIDGVFTRAVTGEDDAAVSLLHGAIGQQRELDAMVAQFLVANIHAQELASAANRGIYDRVAGDLLALTGILILLLSVAGGWIVIQNRRAFEEVRAISEELRTLSWHTLRLQEDLQRSMSRELHDDFGQIVTAIGTLLGRVQRRNAQDPALVAELESVRGIAQQQLDRIRTQSQWLHPAVLDDFGLEKALERAVEQFERQTGIETTLAVVGPVDAIAPQLSIHVYRITQEALNNIARHSGSPRADVRLTCEGRALALDIADRGSGLPPAPSMGLGFVSMRERAELMGGRLRLRPTDAGGVTVELRVPDIAQAATAAAGVPA